MLDINTYWPTLSAAFFIILFTIGKLNDRSERLKQQKWLKGEGRIDRVYQHPKLIAYYVVFEYQGSLNYFEERRLFGDIIYKIGDLVPILFDSKSEFLASAPANEKHLFSSKLSIGCQQEAKIKDNSRSSILMDILSIGLIIASLVMQGVVLN